MRKWITCTIMAVMMAAMIFMGTGKFIPKGQYEHPLQA